MANLTQPDLSVFGKLRTVSDYDRLNQEFDMKKQLAQASLISAQAKAAKAGSLNIKSLGEQAFVKAAQGIPLTPEETAAARFLDAKTGGLQFDPVTGSAIQKPSLMDKIPLSGAAPQQQSMSPAYQPPQQGAMPPPQADSEILDIFGGGAPQAPQENEYDAAFQAEMDKAAGNPKLQQQLRLDYSKDKFNMTEAQTKAAGFADRMAESNPIIDSKASAGLDPVSRIGAKIPLIGNIVAGDDYRSFNQAQRDFINAQLRRESGAVINPDEFINAAQQYFPQVGDDPGVLEQKKVNRDAALSSMKRSAGPAYKAPEIKPPGKSQSYKEGTIAKNPGTGERLMFTKGKWIPL